jgi:hypothetical protein
VRSAAQESQREPAVLVWTQDTETLQEVMGFSGSAPEVIALGVLAIGSMIMPNLTS